MRPKIGVIIPTPLRDQVISPADCRRLDSLGDVTWTESERQLTTPEAIELLADCEIGVGSWATPYPTEELLAGCPRLRLWEHVAGTVKHMFGPHLEGRDLTIGSCAPGNAENVAEMVLGELILGVRGVFRNAAANRVNEPLDRAYCRTLARSVVGVIGASQVGRQLIRLLRPFKSTVLLYDPFVIPEEADEMGARFEPDLLALCAASDAITLHTPALESTRHILGAREFQAMPDHAIFINSSRGMCIDEAALIAELEKGRLYAFLDVTDPEPPAADSPFRRLPNVVYTSHIAGPPDFRLGMNAVDDIAAFLRGESLRMAVTPDMLSRIA